MRKAETQAYKLKRAAGRERGAEEGEGNVCKKMTHPRWSSLEADTSGYEHVRAIEEYTTKYTHT